MSSGGIEMEIDLKWIIVNEEISFDTSCKRKS